MPWLQIAGILRGDAAMLGHALDSDIIVEPVRGKLIPGFRCDGIPWNLHCMHKCAHILRPVLAFDRSGDQWSRRVRRSSRCIENV